MAVVTIQTSPEQLLRLNNALNQVRKLKAASTYQDFYRYYQKRTVKRLAQAQRRTPFADSSLGRRKPRSGRLIPDGLFGVDSGDMEAALTERATITEQGIQIDAPFYTEFVLDLYREKGPYAPLSPTDLNEEDIDVLLEKIEDTVISLIENRLKNAGILSR